MLNDVYIYEDQYGNRITYKHYGLGEFQSDHIELTEDDIEKITEQNKDLKHFHETSVPMDVKDILKEYSV